MFYSAQEVIDKYWNLVLPVDPFDIARKAGVRVEEKSNLNVSGELTEKDEQPVIYYNSKESHLRQRFTMAHELGHYFLNHGKAFRDPAKNFSIDNYDQREAAANRFAADLLIPENVLEWAIQKYPPSVEKLAEVFKVSGLAMQYRLKNLGYLDYV